jgi:RNA polymerase sigma-70 factor (ECF subfamily)
MVDGPSDETLMQSYCAGDARAFETLYNRHKGPLYRYFLRQCRIAAVAEELFQDVWLNLIRARARYVASAKFTTYLYHLAHNRLIDHYRRQAHGLPVSYDDDPEDPPAARVAAPRVQQPDAKLALSRQIERLAATLGQLPEAQREVFLLREEGGLSLEEIALTTGVNIEAAKSRLRYALTKLRQGMADEIEP